MLTKQDELAQWVRHLRENALLYTVSAVFVALCLAAGLFYRVNQSAAERLRMTTYARAVQMEEPAQRLATLEKIALGKDKWSAEVLYMIGETAILAAEYDRADKAFARVCAEFAASEFAPRAAEGLGFLAENRGDFVKALSHYQEVGQKWPGSFSARIQPLNIGRVQEAMGDLKAAADAYQSQSDMFPGSHAARKAEMALERLRAAHPELFPKPDAPDAEDSAGGDVAAAPPVAEEATPAEAAEAAAPAEDAQALESSSETGGEAVSEAQATETPETDADEAPVGESAAPESAAIEAAQDETALQSEQ